MSGTMLTPHFSLEEFIASEEASRNNIDNTMPPTLTANAVQTCMMMERIRAILCARVGRDVPILVSSGYRCLALNRRLGSADTSDHVQGFAMDWRCPAFGTPTQLSRFLAGQVDALGIGQLINEFPDREGWVHCSAKMVDKPINRIITITSHGTLAGIQEK